MFHLTSRQLCAGMIFFIPALHWAAPNQAAKGLLSGTHTCEPRQIFAVNKFIKIGHLVDVEPLESVTVASRQRPSTKKKQRRNGPATRRTEPVEPARRARRAALIVRFVNFVTLRPAGAFVDCDEEAVQRFGDAEEETKQRVNSSADLIRISHLTNNLWLVWPCPLADKLTSSKRREFPAITVVFRSIRIVTRHTAKILRKFSRALPADQIA
ncbi:hypothetical protein C8R45DRAFT_932884 [Mycena sanguinolenta]|nr:hypothetical protein C8R45DRAFT_932884 [Mycena sanguinolenta]